MMDKDTMERAKTEMLAENLRGLPTFLEYACVQSMFSVVGRRKQLDGNYYVMEGFDAVLNQAYRSSENEYFSTRLFENRGFNTTNLLTVGLMSYLLIESPFVTLWKEVPEMTNGACSRVFDLFDAAERPDYGLFATAASRLIDTPSFHCAAIGLIYSQRQGKLHCETDFFSAYSEAFRKTGLEKSVIVHAIPEALSGVLFKDDSLSLVFQGNSDKAVDDLIRAVDRITAKPFLPDDKDCRDMIDLLCWSHRLQMRSFQIIRELGEWVNKESNSDKD